MHLSLGKAAIKLHSATTKSKTKREGDRREK